MSLPDLSECCEDPQAICGAISTLLTCRRYYPCCFDVDDGSCAPANTSIPSARAACEQSNEGVDPLLMGALMMLLAFTPYALCLCAGERRAWRFASQLQPESTDVLAVPASTQV